MKPNDATKEETEVGSVAWVLACGCEPEIEHCAQCDERRKLRADMRRQQERLSSLRSLGWEPGKSIRIGEDGTVHQLEQVGWQWIDDGIGDGGLMALSDSNLLLGDSRLKPVYRDVEP